MQLRNGKRKLDAYQSNLRSRHLDIATVVFSHVQCVKTRVNLALVSKLWRDASKPAAAYPLTFDFDPRTCLHCMRSTLSHTPVGQRRSSVSTLRESRGLLGEDCEATYATYAARRGSVRLLKWARENNLAWSADHVRLRSLIWTLARSPVLARERVPLGLEHVL